VNMRIARGENTEKIKDEIDEKVNFRDEAEKILGINVLFGLAYIGADISYFSSSMSSRYFNDAKKIVPGINILLGTLSTVAPFLAIGLVIYDIYEFIKDIKEKKISEIDKTIQLKKYWDSLIDSERKMLCYRLDMKNGLRPGASEEFLKNMLTENKLEDLRKEINNIKNDIRKNLEEFERKLDNFKKEYGEVLDDLSKLNEDFKFILDKIKLIFEQLKKVDISSSGLKQVDDIKTLQQYYNVDPRLLVDIYDQFSVFKGKIIGKGTNKKFSSLVHDIWEWNKDKPGIYVITGPTGTGKSWFTYRLISKIFERNRRSKSRDQKEFSFYQIENPSRFRYPVINEGNEKCIMFIDDSRIPLDSINRIENIIDEF